MAASDRDTEALICLRLLLDCFEGAPPNAMWGALVPAEILARCKRAAVPKKP